MKSMRRAAVLVGLIGGIIVSGGVASADSGATGAAVGSPGVLSGNVVQIPIDIPVNACGNSINLIGILNPAFGNTCLNIDEGKGAWKQSGVEEGGRNHILPQPRQDDGCADGRTESDLRK